ncbi:MAG: hypothetical protein RLZZ608_253 [Actinomycetota bacterium]
MGVTRISRAAALALVPAFLLCLAACVPEPAPVGSTPEPSASETAAAPTSTAPGSRVPADCAAIFDTDAVSGGAASAITRESPFFRGTFDQVGYLACQYNGVLGDLETELEVYVAVDVPPTVLDENVAAAADPINGFATDIAGDVSFSTCGVAIDYETDRPGCRAQMVVGTYALEVIVYHRDAAPSDLEVALQPLLDDLVSHARSWPTAVAAWERPADALAWSSDCAGEIPAQQDVVRGAVPFAVDDAKTEGSGDDGSWSSYLADEILDSTHCSWSGPDGAFTLRILPGGAWMHEAGVTLPGAPIELDGALAAGLQWWNPESAVLTAYIDGSLVQVNMFVDDGGSPELVARDVIAALVTAF